MKPDFFYTEATEAELNELVVGRRAGRPMRWIEGTRNRRLPIGYTGVVWREPSKREEPVHPLVLVCREEDQRRLCGRFAQLRSDLSPLTVWCHLLTPERFEIVDTLARDADLSGYEAAWTGLVIAEALLLAERSIAKLRIASCLATQSYAIARSAALWPRTSLAEVVNRFDAAQRLFRTGEARNSKLRTALEPIWGSLADAGSSDLLPSRVELRPLVESLRRLRDARQARDENEALVFSKSLWQVVPEVEAFTKLREWTPEQRVQEFDKLLRGLDDASRNQNGPRRVGLAFLAGYLATVAAGGAASLSLAEAVADQWPDITAWACVLGGIGERVVWTSSFDGLGRLVARELLRPLRLDESPTSDFGLDEAQVLADPQLSDPLVHLRLKQSRAATVALLPGVNVAFPIMESGAQEPARTEAVRYGGQANQRFSSRGGTDPVAVFADALWPYLRARLERSLRNREMSNQSYRNRERAASDRNLPKGPSQSGLPLSDPDEP
jgi:hypothetical protein